MSARAIVDRMRAELGAKSDAEMARVLGVSAGTPAAWVRRGSVPQRYLAEVSARTNATVDWLLTGEGEAKRKDAVIRLYLMPELLEIAIHAAEVAKSSIDHLKNVSVSQLAALIDEEYDRASRLFHEFKDAGLNEEAVIKAIRRSSDMPEESQVIDWMTGEPFAPRRSATSEDSPLRVGPVGVYPAPSDKGDSDPDGS